MEGSKRQPLLQQSLFEVQGLAVIAQLATAAIFINGLRASVKENKRVTKNFFISDFIIFYPYFFYSSLPYINLPLSDSLQIYIVAFSLDNN